MRTKLDLSGAVPVQPRLEPGVGRWLMVLCPGGHLLHSVAWGEWTEARKRYERADEVVLCVRCGRNGKA